MAEVLRLNSNQWHDGKTDICLQTLFNSPRMGVTRHEDLRKYALTKSEIRPSCIPRVLYMITLEIANMLSDLEMICYSD